MIKEFKGYTFILLLDNDLDPLRLRSWTKMNEYMREVGSTVYIDIPVDSVIKYSNETIRWRAEYQLIFQNNASSLSHSHSHCLSYVPGP